MSNKIDEELKKRFKNTFEISNNDINNFILLLRKGVYFYEKEEFYSNLNMEDIIDAFYMHEKRVCKNFEIKKSGECHDLYLKSDTCDTCVSKTVRKMCLKIYHLDAAKFFSAPELA